MKIKKRLQINVTIATTTVVVIILMIVSALVRVDSAVTQSEITGDILSAAFERSALRADYLRNNNNAAKIQWFAKHERIGNLLKAAANKFQDSSDQAILDKMVRDHEETGELFMAIVENRKKTTLGETAMHRSLEAENRLVSQLEVKLYDKVLYAEELRESAGHHLLSSLKMAGGGIILLITVLGLMTTFNSWKIGRTIVKDINLLRDGASIIGKGILDYKIEIKGDDEFAELADAFNTMTDKLQSSYLKLENEIGARNRAEAALSNNEKLLQLFIEYAPAALAMFDRDMRYLRVSRRWRNDHTLDDKDLLGLSHYEVFPELPERWKEAHRRGMTGEVLRAEDDRFERRDGSVQWMRWEIRPWFDLTGNVGGIILFTEDITESKKIEESLRASERRERERAEEMAATLDAVPTPVVIVHDPDSLHMTGNSAADDLLRQPRGAEASLSAPPEVKPRHFRAVKDGRELNLDELPAQRAARGEYVQDFEFTLIFDDGTIRHLLGYGTPLLDARGRPRGAVHVLVDITERKQTEKHISDLNNALKRNIKDLEATNKELEAFIYSIAHDLREPLRSISGFSEMLLKANIDENGQKQLQWIIRSADQMSKIIDDLLYLSKISRQELYKENLDISQILRSLLAELHSRYPERHVTAEIQDGMIGHADGRLMHLALSNLLGNAWKFTSKKIDARIECGTLDRDGRTVYYIKDNGAGFAQDLAEKIFLPFHRLHSEEEFEGSGIGLAIVERVIRRQGGTIWAESKVNEGTVVYFTMT